MKKEELYNRLSEELKDFTILNFQYEDPFGWDYSYPKKQPKPKEKKKEEPYRAEKDKRLKDLLTTKQDQDTKRDFLSYTALCITIAFSKYRFIPPKSDKIKELMHIASVTAEEMDDFTWDIPYDTLSCFHDTCLNPYSILFYKVLWDALCEGAGIRCWSNSKKKQYPNRKEHPYLTRLFNFLKYSKEHHIFAFQIDSTSSKDISKSEKEEAARKKIESSIKGYEDCFTQIAVLECKRRICISELARETDRMFQEEPRIDTALRRCISQIVRSSKRQKVQLPLAKSAEELRNSAQSALENGTLSEVLSLTLPPDISAPANVYHKQYEKNLLALIAYRKKLSDNFRIQMNDIILQMSDFLESFDENEVAEGMLMAILAHDEVYTLNIGNYLHYYMGQPLGIPSYNFGYPDLDDEDQWDDDPDMYYDNDLTEELFSANETVTYNDTELIDTDILNTIKFNSLIASFSDFHVDEGIYIRKSVINAFESLGFEKSKARELAVCVASLSFARRQLNSFPPDMYSTFYDEKPAEPSKVSQEDADKLQKSLDLCMTQKNDAIRRQKQCEIDNQKLRHANAELERENEQLQKTIEQLQNQLKTKPVIPQKEIVSVNEEKKNPFPYETDKNIILFGGFDSFCRAITQMIPDVRCVPCSTHLDLNLFKNADLVFIQANRLSHSNYWTVISALKKSNVPFYHLNPASPKRCALEMIKEIEDLKNS